MEVNICSFKLAKKLSLCSDTLNFKGTKNTMRISTCQIVTCGSINSFAYSDARFTDSKWKF